MSKTAEKINKSKMVRDYLAANKDADTNSVVEHFKSEGIEINKQFVYQTRTHMKNPKKRSTKAKAKSTAKTTAKTKTRTSSSNPKMDHYDSLVAAKKLLDSVGGDLGQAKKSLDTLTKLIS